MSLLLTLLVVVDRTPATTGMGGRPAATLAAGIELEARGPARGAWAPVRVHGSVSFDGFVRRDHLGCRAGADLELTPLGRTPPAKVRRGALLRRLGTRGDLLEVSTVGPIALRGTIPATACVEPGTPYFDQTPREGELRLLQHDAELLDAPDGAVRLRLPTGVRFQVRETRDGWSGGRTDGPVLVDGWIPSAALGGGPQGSPLDILTRPLDHTHEILAPTALSVSRRGRPSSVQLAGGAPVDVLESTDGRVRVRTVGSIVAEGWVPEAVVREVSASEESIDLPRGAARRTPPARGPRMVVP